MLLLLLLRGLLFIEWGVFCPNRVIVVDFSPKMNIHASQLDTTKEEFLFLVTT